MKKNILIDTSELKETKNICIFSNNGLLIKEKLRKSLNQMITFSTEEEEVYLTFENKNDGDSFFLSIIKQLCYQILSLLPKSFGYYESNFISSFYKYGLKYKIDFQGNNSIELKLKEDNERDQVISFIGKWSSDIERLHQHTDKSGFRIAFLKYVASLLIATISTFVLSVLWFQSDMTRVSVKTPRYVIPVFLGVISIVHTFRGLWSGIKQYRKLKKNNWDLSCFANQ